MHYECSAYNLRDEHEYRTCFRAHVYELWSYKKQRFSFDMVELVQKSAQFTFFLYINQAQRQFWCVFVLIKEKKNIVQNHRFEWRYLWLFVWAFSLLYVTYSHFTLLVSQGVISHMKTNRFAYLQTFEHFPAWILINPILC